MVTEYNRNILIRRRMEAEAIAKAAESIEAPTKDVEVQDAEPVAEVKPRTRKTDAEKLKKGKK